MAWNTPGGNKNQPSWGPSKGENKGPPEIEAILKKLLGRSKQTGQNQGQGEKKPARYWLIALWSLVGLALLWLASGLYSVDSVEEAVLLYGNEVSVVGPGLHWYPRFFADKVIVNMSEEAMNFTHVLPLGQGGVVGVTLSLKYHVSDAKQYVLAGGNSTHILAQFFVGAAYRNLAALGGMTDLNAAIQPITQSLTQATQTYQLGINIEGVTLSVEGVPNSIQQAVSAIQSTEAANQAALQKAQSDANQTLNQAKSLANQIKSSANVYSQEVVLSAQTKTAAFKSALAQYEAAPSVTATRMYFDTLQQLFSTHAVVLSNADVVYLPVSNVASAPAALAAPPKPPLKIENTAPLSKDESNQDMSDYTRWEEAQGQ